MKSLRLSLLLLLAPTLAVAQGLVSDLNVQRTVRFGTTTTGTISPAQITSNQNDYAPSGIASAFRLRISSDANRTITGLAAGQAGEIKILTNIGSTYTITLADSSGSSTAANQFALAGDFLLLPDSAVPIEYDGTSQRWRIWGPTAAMLSSSYQPIDAALTALAGGSDFVVFSGPASSNKTFTLPNASATILTDNAAVTVAQGGTGRATGTTAYGLIAAGTTATGAQQTLAAGGTAQILVGGGASALPVWTTATGSGAPVRATSPALDTPTVNSAGANALTLNRNAGGSADIRFQRAGVDKGYIADNGDGITVYDAAAVGRAAVTSIGLAVTGNISTDGTVSARNSGVLLSGSAANPYIQLSDTVGASYLEVSGGVLRLVPRAGQTASITASLAVTGSISATSRFTIGSGAGTGALYNAGFTSAQEGAGFTSADDGSGATFASFRKASGAAIGSINRVGTTDAIVVNTTSDGRLKTNVRDFTAEDSGRLIDRLRPVWHDWKSGGKDVVGFIAQEENAVDPVFARIGAVTVGDSDPVTITKQWQRSDAPLVPILVAELKALRARVARLEAAAK